MKIKPGKQYLWENRTYTVEGFYINMEGEVCKNLVFIAMLYPRNENEGYPRIVSASELTPIDSEGCPIRSKSK